MMTIKERLKRIAAWVILDGPRFLTYGIFAFAVVAAVGGLLYSLVTKPLELLAVILFYVCLFGAIFLLGWIRARLATLNEDIVRWAKKARTEAAKPETKPRITWSGTAPDDEWYVVSEGGSKSGPTNRANAERIKKMLEDRWGNDSGVTIRHKSEFQPDPILEDLRRLNG